MEVEMTIVEAELLMAVLTAAEDAFVVTHRPLAKALDDLRPWRSQLLQAYLRTRMGIPVKDDAVSESSVG